MTGDQPEVREFMGVEQRQRYHRRSFFGPEGLTIAIEKTIAEPEKEIGSEETVRQGESCKKY
jgi:hypothetical protein